MLNWKLVRPTISITEGCNFQCRHCAADCGPGKFDSSMTPDEVTGIVTELASAGCTGIGFSGGECTLNPHTLLAGVYTCNQLQLPCAITTNGWWGRDETTARRYFDSLTSVGQFSLLLSVDEYHLEFHPFDDIKRILKLSREYGISTMILFAHRGHDYIPDMEALLGEAQTRILVQTQQIYPGMTWCAGRARQLDLKPDWKVWECHELRMPNPSLVVLPGKRLFYRCSAYNPNFCFEYDNLIKRIEQLDSSPFFQSLERYGLTPLYRKVRTTGSRDHCEYCINHIAELKRMVTA